MIITILSGGVGGARFSRGVREHLRRTMPDGNGGTTADLRIIVNTGDDMWLAGLRITPDLDSVMYTLAGANDEERGWGRLGESERVSAELEAYGVGWPWFTLGDLDLGTHIARSSMLRDGIPFGEVVTRITSRWNLGATLIPMTESEVETHVVVDPSTDGGDDGNPAELHFQEWWTRYRASLPARGFVQHGVQESAPAPGVLEAIEQADVILVAPSNPVVSIATILAVPGVRDAVAAASAPVIGVSPIIGGAVVRGMADACLAAIGVATDAAAVAEHYGSRSSGGLLDGWLVDDADSASIPRLESLGLRAAAVPLYLRDPDTSAGLAADALALADR